MISYDVTTSRFKKENLPHPHQAHRWGHQLRLSHLRHSMCGYLKCPGSDYSISIKRLPLLTLLETWKQKWLSCLSKNAHYFCTLQHSTSHIYILGQELIKRVSGGHCMPHGNKTYITINYTREGKRQIKLVAGHERFFTSLSTPVSASPPLSYSLTAECCWIESRKDHDSLLCKLILPCNISAEPTAR